jgi:hypothetical protein
VLKMVEQKESKNKGKGKEQKNISKRKEYKYIPSYKISYKYVI